MTYPAFRTFAFSLTCCLAAGTLLLVLSGCGDSSPGYAEFSVDSTDTRSKRITQFLARGDSLSRFVSLLEDTGLDDQLQTFGPWTVFVPENEAFQRAAYRLDTLYRSQDLDSLRQVLSIHVVRGRIDTSDVQDSLLVATLYEEPVPIERIGRGFTVKGANVTDYIPAQNGAIYIIDQVLELPPPDTSAQHDILFF